MPIGVPGWPELAFWTWSMHSPQIVLMARVSMSVFVPVVLTRTSLVDVPTPGARCEQRGAEDAGVAYQRGRDHPRPQLRVMQKLVRLRRASSRASPWDYVAHLVTRDILACLAHGSSQSEALVHPPVPPIGHRARFSAPEDGQPAAPGPRGQWGPLGSPPGAKGYIVEHGLMSTIEEAAMTTLETDVHPVIGDVPIRNGNMKLEAVVMPVWDLGAGRLWVESVAVPRLVDQSIAPLYRALKARPQEECSEFGGHVEKEG